MLGHPLLIGDEFLALSQDDLLVRWKLREYQDFVTIAHPTAATREPDMTPVAKFGGYPLAKTPTGFVIADDLMNPFIGVFSDLRTPVWHRNVMSRLGVPAVEGNNLFMNIGGNGALAGLVAMDSTTGSELWQYVPQGYPSEPVTMNQLGRVRPPTAEEQQSIKDLQSAAQAKGLPIPRAAQVTELTYSPAIDARHGHWDNPGIVVSNGHVYGYVGNSLVSLDQANGKVAWRFGTKEKPRSIAATQDHLFVSLDRKLIAIDLKTGKQTWSQTTKRAGTLTIAHGRVYLAMGAGSAKDLDGGELIVFESAASPETASGN